MAMEDQLSLISELYADRVDPEELGQIVLETLGAAAYPSANEVVYRRPGLGPALHFFYSGDRLSAIEAGPSLSSTDIQAIKHKVQSDLINVSGNIIGRAVLLSEYPVKGHYAVPNILSISPVPESAPKPKESWERNFPFLLEFVTKDSPDFKIRMSRIASLALRLSLFLNVIVEGSIMQPNTSQRFRWVSRESEGRVYEHLREGYGYQGFQPWQESFTDLASIEVMELINHNEYFTRFGYETGRSLQLPNSIAELTSAYLGLDRVLQDRFIRAAYWYSLAQCQDSASARFLHLIQSIETLVPDAERGQTCSECRRTIDDGPTKRFVTFLDTMVPSHENLRKGRRHLYKLRSDLSHGWDLFSQDLRLASAPKSMDQMMQGYEANQLARLALVNWLASTA